MMPFMENIIREKLIRALAPQALEIIDESLSHAGHTGARSEGNTHFHIKLTAQAFGSLSRLERHRVVYEILKAELNGHIHALSLDLRSPQER